MGSSASQEDKEPLLRHDEEIEPIFEELKLVLIGSQGAGKNTIANAILKEKVFTFWTPQEDQEPLLEHDEEIEPIFEELKLVLIGCQGAGKNTIANAILKEKVFTFWTSYKSVYMKDTRRVSGTQIHLARTPGWRGDLSRSEQTKREIVHCVQSLYNSGPHAVILALKVNSVLSESNISTLESLLTVQLWKHTIVLFTHGEKLGHCSIEDHIISEQLQPLIEKCGKRYFVIRRNDCNQVIETIEKLIVRLSTGQKIIWYKDIDRTAGFETQTLRDVNVSDGGKYACAEIGKTTVSQALVLTVRVQNDEIDQYAVIEK
ncbi:GTPase IMAP family member 4-like protein [Labeo rohita]|uniref:GTPase IMAP family member 4-like protein n=1 Tax=Labeo rohita TaxID=84645 RepID=A0A498MCE2_LABRO|nr:GTPase IMAP family member 4-like protein [Labeo rohita]